MALACFLSGLAASAQPPPAARLSRAGDANAPATPAPQGHIVRRGRVQMGTWVELTAWVQDVTEAQVVAAFEQAFAEITRLEKLMSPYIESSDVARVNAAAGKGPVVVSPETFEVLELSQKISRLSAGKFDITFAALHGLWKFDDEIQAKVPDPAEVRARLKLIDHRKVRLDRRKRTVAIGRGQRIDLGGIAKGYAADRAAAALEKAGLKSFMVQAGGDLIARGKKGTRPWQIGIRDPRGKRGSFFAVAPVVDHAFSTSGDYERFFFLNGKRYHHIIDPQTGFPSGAARSVTLWAKDAFTADALDTTVLMLGPEKGLKLLEKFPGVGAVIVDAKNRVHITPNLRSVVRVLRPPTDGD